MDVTRGCVVLVAVVAPSTVGCVGILGLDHGVPDDPDGPADVAEASVGDEASIDHASAPDGVTSQEDSSRGDSVAPDVAAAPDVAGDHAADAVVGSDATGTDAGCRAALQPCQVNTDCCSGTCGVGLTCL
jgi:hypothetical protein